MPARMVELLRPVWVAPPSRNFLLAIYLQSKCVGTAETGKILTFLCSLETQGEAHFGLLEWIRRE